MRLVFSPLAARDLEAIGDYIANLNPVRAASFVGTLRNRCTKIAHNPQGYRLRPELGVSVRSCAHGKYVIFFLEDGSAVRILRILHSAMDVGGQFDQIKKC